MPPDRRESWGRIVGPDREAKYRPLDRGTGSSVVGGLDWQIGSSSCPGRSTSADSREIAGPAHHIGVGVVEYSGKTGTRSLTWHAHGIDHGNLFLRTIILVRTYSSSIDSSGDVVV